MNIAMLLTPKGQVSYLYADSTLRQALEKMRHHGYTAIPVIDREGRYVGTVSEGDFLWHLIEDPKKKLENIPITAAEEHSLREILVPDREPPVKITATAEELAMAAMNQNFVPVVDDLGSFIGIVTRKKILGHFYSKLKQAAISTQ